MTTLRAPSASFLEAFLPVFRARVFAQLPLRHGNVSRQTPLLPWRRLRVPLSSLLPAASIAIPWAHGPLKDALDALWNGLLNAVPKKKTSYSKKRSRQMAGKALKDVTALNKCSACGRAKRAHVLCPYCVQTIKRWIGNGFKTEKEVEAAQDALTQRYNEELRIRGKKLLDQPKDKDRAPTADR